MGRCDPFANGSQLFFSRQKTDADASKVKIENIYVDSKYKDKEASRGQANTDYLRMPS